MKIHLKKGEKIFVNGAVIKVDQKCSIEFLNNVAFLLEAHVMQPDSAITPFQQLYFVIQTLLMSPESEAMTREMYWHHSDALHRVIENRILTEGLLAVDEMVKNLRYFDALKEIRKQFPHEKNVMGKITNSPITLNQRKVA